MVNRSLTTGAISHLAKEYYFSKAKNFSSIDPRPGVGVDADKYHGDSSPATQGLDNSGFPVGEKGFLPEMLGNEGETGFKGISDGSLYVGFKFMEVVNRIPGGAALSGMHDWMERTNHAGLGGSIWNAGIATITTYTSFESPF